jgi:hypothetical protein
MGRLSALAVVLRSLFPVLCSSFVVLKRENAER